MPKYVKAVKGWKFKLGEQGLAGTETYHRDDGNPTPGVTLPTVGSTPFVDPDSGSTFPYCICTSEEGEFPEGDDTAVTYRYEYTTLRNEFKNDPAARKFNSNIEVVSKKANEISGSGVSGYTWFSDTANVENMEITKRVFNVQFAIPIIVSSANFNNWITGTVAQCAGKINGTTFDHWEIGTVLFDGISGGSRYDAFGNPQWAFDLNFTLKIIPDMKNVTAGGGLGTPSQYTWQHSLRGTAFNHGWDKVMDPGGNPIFETCDMTILNNHGAPLI